MTLLVINQKTEEDTLACVLAFAKELNIDLDQMHKEGKKAFANIVPRNAAVVIDGRTLTFALQDKVRNNFLCLCCSCMAAIVW
jgi:hypothetical protein